MKLLLQSVGIILLILLLGFGFTMYEFLSIPGEVRKSIENESYRGIILDIDTSSTFSKIYIREGNQPKIMEIDAFCNKSMLRYIKTNDSLEKKQGEMILTIKRTELMIRQFNYETCFR
ncbi:MAG: hypothetical protein EOP53_00870 [Sphingobacteriales bacterium]|nr:MAG: hypothetical protein EOP53_00870 [Sphingobacteriales bacterium]